MPLPTNRDRDLIDEQVSPERQVMRNALEQAEHWLQEHARNPGDSCEPVEMLRVIGEALAMDKARTQLWEDIREARANWMRCSPGCEECAGFGWAIFNMEDAQTDDACRTAGRCSLQSDEEAQTVANTFGLFARRVLGLFARGVLDAGEARALARAMLAHENELTA